MTSNLYLKTRQCMVWKTEVPFVNRPRESPQFDAMGCKWHFQVVYEKGSNDSSSKYSVYLVNSTGSKTFPPFSVETFVEDKENAYYGTYYLTCSFVQYPSAQIWTNYISHFPNIKESGYLTVVCIIHTPAGHHVLPTDDKSLQTTFSAQGSVSESCHPVILDSPLNFESLSQDIGNMLEKHLMPDVQLKSREHIVSAHKNVLAARSQVFSAMFQHEMAENKSGVIDIKDMDPPVLDAFLKYLYSGKVPDNLPVDMVPKLYAAGDKYAVGALKKVCSDFLASSIKEDNFLEILVLADAHGDKELKQTVVDFVTEHDELLECDIWNSFLKEYPNLAIQVYQKYVANTRSK